MSNVKSIMVTALIMMGVTFSQNSLTLTNLDTEAGTVDVYMVNEDPVGGYQFGLAGLEMTGGSGGSSADAGFTISASSTTLLAFSFTGATIPAGEGVLVSVSFENSSGSTEACIEGAVVSDATGGGLDFTEGCIALIEGGGCMDSDACNYDSDAQFDDGSCEYAQDNYDCDGNCLVDSDCAGECGGSAVIDECGDCDGAGASIECWDGAFVCDELDCSEEVVDVNISISNVTSDNVEVSVSLNAEMGGFQFTLDSSCDGLAWTGGSGGLAEDAGFTISTGATGIVLGFSLTGATIASGSEGVLINLGTAFDCDEATFSIAAGTFSSPAGTALTYNLGSSFDYPGAATCPDGQTEACDGQCYDAGDGPVLDDCGDCLYSYCYDMETHIPDYMTTEEDCTDSGNAWVNPGDEGDPTFNGAMDCAGVCGGDAMEDCAGECGGTSEEDACGDCGGDATDSSECLENYVVDLEWTGVSQLTIFQTSITSLEAGDEIGVFDAAAITNSGDCSSEVGGSLVGSGIWTGEQLEVVSIGSVDNCAFGGFQLPGWVDGNEVMIKVYRPSEDVEYAGTATYSAGTGTFGDLFMAISELTLEEPNPPFYNVELNATGVNQLLILTASITGLEAGDEIGIFDAAAITNSGDCSSTLGELLVGAGVWSDEQLEIVAVGSVDNCAFGGSQLPGWVDGNSVVLKVYRPSVNMEYAATATYSAGTGTFGDLFMAVSEIDLGDVLANDDVWLGPDSYTLSQNYPNPFNPSTDISFDAGVSGEISLVIYDILGNQVKTLVTGFVTPGQYVVSWNGTDNSGNDVSSGVYVYTLITSNQTISKRMLLVK